MMMKKKKTIFAQELWNQKKNKKAAVFILITFLLSFFCNLEWYLQMIKTGMVDAVVVYDIGIINTAWFFPTILTVASAASIYDYCCEWKNGYWKQMVFRSGVRAYILEKPRACFVRSVLIYFCGGFLYLLCLLITAKAVGAPFGAADTCPMPEHPFVYLLLCNISLSLVAGFWSTLTFLLATWQMDIFMAVTLPLAGYVSLTYLLRKSFLNLSLVSIATLKTDEAHPLNSLLISVALFTMLSWGCVTGARKLLSRRIENEHIA